MKAHVAASVVLTAFASSRSEFLREAA
jgi:hypothetical protein